MGLWRFCCLICKKVMNQPFTTFASHVLKMHLKANQLHKKGSPRMDEGFARRKNVPTCPACPTDISEFLHSPQVNREIMEVIEKLQSGLDAYANGDAKGLEENSSEKGKTIQETHQMKKQRASLKIALRERAVCHRLC